MNFNKILIIAVAFLLLVAMMRCGSDKSNGSSSNSIFKKNPVDVLIRDMGSENAFSIILHDLDYNESNDEYKHKYKILTFKTQPVDTAISKITKWYPVSNEFFNQHVNDMGMEIASKVDGKVEKETAPPGYSNYVGNDRYGNWQTRSNGSRFWEFYGKYAFMSSMFHMAMMPVRYGMWNDYNRNYRGRGYGRTYYGGTSNSRYYGTRSNYSSRTMKNNTWASKPQTYKQKIRSKVSRSKTNPYSSRSRVSRNSNRVSSRSSMRSRSRGFGK